LILTSRRIIPSPPATASTGGESDIVLQ